MNKVKVLHIITRLDPGGSATNTIETVSRLDKSKFDVFLIYGNTQDPQRVIQQLLQDKQISYSYIEDLQREISFIKDILAFIKLFSFLKKNKFDIVHTHTSKAGMLGRWAAWLAGVPKIIHTPHGHVFYGYFSKTKTQFFIFLERLTAKITTNIITLTDMGKNEHVAFKIAPEYKFHTIYSGIDLKVEDIDQHRLDQIRTKFKIPQEGVVFGIVARLVPIKGINYIIEALADIVQVYPYTHLLIVGDGEERNNLIQLTAKLGIQSHVSFVGHQEQVQAFIKLMDVFVLSSLNEGMGRVLLEAMVQSKPIIATKVGGVPELINDQINGLLIPSKDVKALSNAMKFLIENLSIRVEMGIKGSQQVKERFSLDKMVQDIENLYKQ